MSDTAIREVFVKAVAEESGWLRDRDLENAKEIARTLLSLGDPVEKVAEATKLPLETVRSLA